MPIRGRTLREAAETFRVHINRALTRTVTRTPVFVIPAEETHRVHVAFRLQGQPAGVPLATTFGTVHLFLGQVCASVLRDAEHELRTVKYRYAITPEGAPEPVVRWEYDRIPQAETRRSRHHLQGDATLRIGEHAISLNALHLPTGYVPFEEGLRFCIADLGVPPLAEDWGQVLRDSYEQFKTEFTE